MNIRQQLWRRVLGYEAREERELAEWSRQRQEREDREDKRRLALESDAKFMAMLKRVAHGSLGAAGDARFTMVGSIRTLQVPIATKEPLVPRWAFGPSLFEPPQFHAENIDLARLPTWFVAKFYDLYAGYGPESKLVAWRLGAYQW